MHALPAGLTLYLGLGTIVIAQERQITSAPYGHVLSNTAAWSHDGQWLAYDVREDPNNFTGTRIERVNIDNQAVEIVYQSPGDSACGVVTWHPSFPRIVFIQGPENPDVNWTYSASRRRGMIVDLSEPIDSARRIRPLDATDYSPPFTLGDLRGGSHVHTYSPDGQAVSFTYEDELLARPTQQNVATAEPNQRNIGVSFSSFGPVHVAPDHPRNHDGDWFSVLISKTTARSRPGSDEISRAVEEGSIGLDGYIHADGSHQTKALAFLGRVTAIDGREHDEVFIVDLPSDPTLRQHDAPLEGTLLRRPAPPTGTTQRRLTFTDTDKYPGVPGPRHWLRSSSDGEQIAFLRRDEQDVVQFWLVPALGGAPRQLTSLSDPPGVNSAFSWSPDGGSLAAVINDRVCLIQVRDGTVQELTKSGLGKQAPRDLACVSLPTAAASPTSATPLHPTDSLTRKSSSPTCHRTSPTADFRLTRISPLPKT